MKRLILGTIGIIILVFVVKVWAATEIEKINVDFSNQDATLYFQSGDFVSSNSVITNGDTVTTNSFVPNGGTLTRTQGIVNVNASNINKKPVNYALGV